eukprot:jgi/Orpsp1_1/1191405/evm.model.d7180000085540.1
MKSILFSLLVAFIALTNVVNAHTYESLGVDALEKEEFIKKTIEETKFPVVSITTRNNNELILSRDNYTDCVVDIFNVDERFQLREKSASIRVRGNSSAFYGNVEKIMNNTVPYRIKFDKKVNLMGLHHGEKYKNWVLLKPGYDIIRNDVAYRMGRAITKEEYYVTEDIYVKVYINNKFVDIFLLAEHNEVDRLH